MGSPPRFDYRVLRDLKRDHPDWSRGQLARAVTEHERRVRKDPGYPAISPNSVGSAITRYQDRWREEGVSVPPLKRAPSVRTQPWAGIPKDWWFDNRIEMLRLLTRIHRGDPDIHPSKRRSAEKFGIKLREHRQVVDLTAAGRPYIRAARPDELDQEGNLVFYHARYPGLSDAQWEALGSPDMRAIASAHWLTDYESPTPGEPPRKVGVASSG